MTRANVRAAGCKGINQMTIMLDQKQEHPMVATVMVIDDQITSRIILETVIQSIGDNIKVQSFSNGKEALDAAAGNPPDLITVDYKMPEMDGVEFTRRLREMPNCADVPVIVITIMEEKSVMYQALEAGATDYLHKPVDHYECKVRCRNLLTLRRQQLIIKNRAVSLETKVREAVEQTHVREKETLSRLAKAGEFKDGMTGEHIRRIASISRNIAEEIGMEREFCDVLEVAAPMHDIGKIGIPDSILLKKGSLTEEEFNVMKTHSEIGYEILKDSPSPYLQMGAIIARHHHEKFSGNGYPMGLVGRDIPIEARIVAVADVFDALLSKRPYKEAWNLENTMEVLTRNKAKDFDQDCVTALQNRMDNILSTKEFIQS